MWAILLIPFCLILVLVLVLILVLVFVLLMFPQKVQFNLARDFQGNLEVGIEGSVQHLRLAVEDVTELEAQSRERLWDNRLFGAFLSLTTF